MISEKEWNKLKAKEQYGMYAAMGERMDAFDKNMLRLWIAVCALSILTVIGILV